jgi:hypothetical protein
MTGSRCHIAEDLMVPGGCDVDTHSHARAMIESHAEELRWIAGVMTGSRHITEQCIEDTIELAKGAEEEWMLPWAIRLLVHFVLERIGNDIHELLQHNDSPRSQKAEKLEASASERQGLRRLPPHSITANCDLLERTCLVLYGYLQYTSFDCGLLLGCPGSWVAPICERAWARLIDATVRQDYGRLEADLPFSTIGEELKPGSLRGVRTDTGSDIAHDELLRGAGRNLLVTSSEHEASMSLPDRGRFDVASSDVLKSTSILLWCMVLALSVLILSAMGGLR